MHLDPTVFNVCFFAAAVLIGACGALQCFWPTKLRALRDRFSRGYDAESPLGRMRERAQSKESGLPSRIGGLVLFCIMLFVLFWSFLGHPALGR